MASWTDIPNSSLESGAPIRAVDGVAFRDNPVAIAEGAVGAPRIVTDAITDSAVTSTKLDPDAPRLRIAENNVYEVGSYIFAIPETTTVYNPGATISGASLNPGTSNTYRYGSGISGTWRSMGYSYNEIIVGSTNIYNASLWLRIA